MAIKTVPENRSRMPIIMCLWRKALAVQQSLDVLEARINELSSPLVSISLADDKI